MHFIVYTFLVVSATSSSKGDNLKFQAFNNEPGIYFAELGRASISLSDWKFIMFYNLTSYWHEWEHLRESRDHLEAACDLDVNNTRYIRNCEELLQPVTYLMETVELRNPMLRASKSRARRAPLDFIGNLMGDLFGVLDQRDAQQYHDRIQELSAGTLQLQQLVHQQTHVLDLTTNLLRKEKEMEKKHYEILHSEMTKILMHEDFMDSLVQLSTATFLFKDTQSDLIDLLSDVHSGRVATRLLPPQLLEEQLRELQGLIPVTTNIPVSKGNYAQVYQLMATKAAIVQDQVIFEVRLPLLERETYQVFNIIPVPTRLDGKYIYIEPEVQYLLVHQQRTWYYPLTAEALRSCRPWTENSRVCKLQGPLYSAQDPSISCEAALITHAEAVLGHCQVRSTIPTVFLRYLQNNQWIMVLPKPTVFDLQCQATLQPVTLQGSGLLTLAPGCIVRGRSVLIISHTDYVGTANHIAFMPTFNLSREVHTHEVVPSSHEINEGLAGLQQSVDILHQQEPWLRMNMHNISHYSISAATLLLVAVVAIIGRRHYKRRKARKNVRPRRPHSAILAIQSSHSNVVQPIAGNLV